MERHRKRRCRGESGREASTERGREREEEGVEREKEQGEEREIGRTSVLKSRAWFLAQRQHQHERQTNADAHGVQPRTVLSVFNKILW